MTKMITAAVRDQHSLIYQAWRCVLGDTRHAVYVSGPITTGPRFIAARLGTATESDVIEANIADILVAAARLREATGRVVIEPGSMSVQNWSQVDYLELWTGLIERHIAEVRFLEGWESSIGCAYEFERALVHGVQRLTYDGREISAREGRELLSGQVTTLLRSGDNMLRDLAERLSAVANRL